MGSLYNVYSVYGVRIKLCSPIKVKGDLQMCYMYNVCEHYSKNDSINYVAEPVSSAASLYRYLDNNKLSMAFLYGRALDNQRSS